MKGIDISAWQEEVNWQGLKDNGFKFVIVKLGENGKLSSSFVEQINAAVDNGMKVGVYYYTRATTADDAASDADFVADAIKTYLNGTVPEMGIWYDMEDSSILNTGADITGLCKTFLDQMQINGLTAGVYSSYNWLTNYIDAAALNAPVWVAQYNSQDDFTAEHPEVNVLMWQFTDHVSDDLPYDGNVYYGE